MFSFHRLVPLVSICTLGIGCATLNVQKPTAAVTGMSVQGVTGQGFTMNFDVNVTNPNSIALPLAAADYELAVSGTNLLDGKSVELAYVDPGYTGQKAADAAEKHKIELSVVKLPEAKRGFVLLPRRWVVERSFAWLARCRRLAKDYERLASTLAGMHLAAFAFLMLARLINFGESS